MKIAIHGRNFNESARPFIENMFNELSRRKVEVQLSKPFRNFLDQNGITHYSELVYEKPDELFDARLIVSMGGDGTLLETISHVGKRQIPAIGINVGRLGFLATVPPERITDMIQALENSQYRIDERTLVEIESNIDLFDGQNFGLNDFTITKTDTSSMITVHTYLNDEFLNSYWADGLIISTPTGSTGYSLSCGGPVLVPHSQNFIITPISPHNLNVRPLVLEDTAVIRLEVKSRSNNFLVSLDARSRVVDENTLLTVRKAGFIARLIKMHDDSFLNTLRSKLSWGLDMRN
ncbi:MULTISPECIES: NAD kinase [unclassified Dyadobacter]|uniref:NAD kinase n=1 Tax=unclassified Dyadobacter TaxID=2625061 RepID=UPI001F1C14E2|nr:MULTISPECIES: NAD kinase [unclassified Dyadobacter]MCE7068748.1 NAD kinase [Dyadobacter sp. CY327]MCF2520910.1 NAD kinase [Dyadobacter sp. CY351]